MINAELMGDLGRLLTDHPDRHRQSIYYALAAGQSTLDPDKMAAVPVTEMRGYADQPVPDTVEDPDRPICQTTACVAGWAAILGAPPDATIDLFEDTVDDPSYTGPDDQCHVHEYAAELLGLDEDQASWMFAGSRTRAELIKALEWLPDHPTAGHDDLTVACVGV